MDKLTEERLLNYDISSNLETEKTVELTTELNIVTLNSPVSSTTLENILETSIKATFDNINNVDNTET